MSKRRPEFDRTDNWDLYVVEARRGASPRQLTTFEGPDMDPDWGGLPRPGARTANTWPTCREGRSS